MTGRQPLAIVLVVVIAGCAAVVRTPFEHEAIDAAGTLAAAAETLLALDEGRLSDAYASASFVSYAEALDGAANALVTVDGAPAQAGDLAEEVRIAAGVVRTPCIGKTDCDRDDQIATLREVSRDLLQAAER